MTEKITDNIDDMPPLASPGLVKFRLMMGADPENILTYLDPTFLAKEALRTIVEKL